jgi:serine/threonine protein kinase
MTGDTEPREVFGPYLVFERLGVGGMATVHRAKKRGIEGFERVSALKRLLPHLAQDDDFVRSFVREAKLAALLQHTNISQIHELGRVGATYFMAMEYVDGWDVRRILRQARKAAGPPPIGVVISIIGDLCDALDYAHRRVDDATREPLGLVHRDVSPSNLIVSRAGHLKVIDFGIAKATADKLKTDTGRVKGKLGYMSPEAVRSSSLDARSDIFSAGIIAHELLTARPLFASRSDYETLRRIMEGEIEPPSRRHPDCPIELDDAVLEALARSPQERWPSAGAMREALHDIAARYALAATPSKVAEWLAWAFDQTGDRDSTGPVPAWRPPTEPAIPSGFAGTPPAEHDDQIIEIAWGGREPTDGLVVVPGVPDLSDQIPDVDDVRTDVITIVSPPAPPARAPTHGRVPDSLQPLITFATTPVPGASRDGLAAVESVREYVTPLPAPPAHDPTWATGTNPPELRRPAAGTTPPPASLALPADTAADRLAARPPSRLDPARPVSMRAPRPPPPRPAPAAIPRPASLRPLRPDAPRLAPVPLPPRSYRVAVAVGAAVGLAVATGAFLLRDDDAPAPVRPSPVAAAPATQPAAQPAHATPAATSVVRPAAAATPTADPAPAAPAAATVSIRSSPEPMAIAVDDALVGATPASLAVSPGVHAIALSDGGVTLWRDKFHAEPGGAYTFHPVLESADGDPIVPAASVVRRRGTAPELDEPTPIEATLCIDRRGKVRHVDVLRAPRKFRKIVRRALADWRYEPPALAGADRVCFAVAFTSD